MTDAGVKTRIGSFAQRVISGLQSDNIPLPMKFINPAVFAVVIVLFAMIAGSSIYVALPGAASPEVSASLAFVENASPSLAETSYQTAQIDSVSGSAGQKLPVYNQAAHTLNSSPFASAEPRSNGIEPAQNKPAFVQSHADPFDLANATQRSVAVSGVSFRLGAAAQRSSPMGDMAKKESLLPLVLHEIDPAIVGISEAQAELLDSLRDTFVYEVGGENQDPGDPEYAERWNAAQPKSDANVRLFFGSEIANKIQLQAAQARYAEIHALGAR